MQERKNDTVRSERNTARTALPSTRHPVPSPFGMAAMTPSAVLALQPAAGNAAVTRMVQRSRHGDAECSHQNNESALVQRSAVHSVLESPGTPMAEPLRQEMEARLGADFSDVRLHTGSVARRAADEIGARAWTSGTHVVIGDGGDGKQTLAHELTHVIQQRQGPVASTDRGDRLSVSSPDDRFERAAERNAQQVMSAPLPMQRETGDTHAEPAASHAGSAIQRQGGDVDIRFREKTLAKGTKLFKGGDWEDGAALLEKAKTSSTNADWGACYLGTPASVSVGYMEKQSNKLLEITLTRDVKLLEIYGKTADDISVSGSTKAAWIKHLRGYHVEPYLIDSILAQGYDGAIMNADPEGGPGKEVIMHWAAVRKVCSAAVAAEQPRWNRMGYFE